jgi:hypothetical protein
MIKKQGMRQMRYIFWTMVILCAVVSSACTTYQPTVASPEEIQRRIHAGGLLEIGDRVKLTTADETVHVHKFRVTELNFGEGLVGGKNIAIRVSAIVALEIRELSWVKTGLLIGGLTLGTTGTECTDDCGELGIGYFCC